MPGLKQLKKFSQDVTALGNESSIRAERGEPFVTVPIPDNVPDIDDSDDFLLGMPLDDEPNSLHPELVTPSGQSEPEAGESAGNDYDPDIAKLLGMVQDDITLPDVEPDLEAFGDFEDSVNTIPPSDIEAESDESDLDIVSEMESLEEAQEKSESDADISMPESTIPDTGLTEPENAFADIDFTAPESAVSDADFSIPDIDGSPPAQAIEDIEDLQSLEEAEELTPVDESEDEVPEAHPDDVPFIPSAGNSKADDSFLYDGIDIQDFTPPDTLSSSGSSGSSGSVESPPEDFMADLASFDSKEASGNADFEGFSPLDLGGSEFDNMPPPDASLSEPNDFSAPDAGEIPNGEGGSEAVPDDGSSGSHNSVLDSLANFDIDNIPSPSQDLSSLDEFETTDGILAGTDDDEGSDDYKIPGFSDFNLQDETASPSAVKSPNAANIDGQAREGLTEAEYKIFKENLKEYPLNLKMAIEEVIVKNEFTDDAVFGLIEKVLQKNTARQVASFMSKYLDISVDVPRDYERRSVNQYEAYKQSIEYQLKNRIIPAVVIAAAGIAVLWSLFFLVNRFVYRPLMAEKLYKEGYELLQESMYPQAELSFAQAVSYKPRKKWFFRYARAYREKNQYDRSRTMYERILTRFNYDKQAGMEYANMELYDLANYEFAEEVVKRKILDYHINDKDAMLLLGDVYLEWATERDENRFPDAYNQYMDLIGLYGSNDEYTKRLLRYYIRTDNLREVLPLKSYFFTEKKSLGSSDLVELSGFLLDKLYGELPPKDEYLRSYIEDVRELLERAVESDPSVPEAHYNFARYFLETGNKSSAKELLETAIQRFDEAKTRKPKRIYKHIDSYRLLGDLYTGDQEYILAEETLGEGIMLYEREAQLSGLKPVPEIGRLYAGIADIDYFISGDLEQARRNYEKAVDTMYDTASVRYRIGYIQYSSKKYLEALGSFIKSSSDKYDDRHLLLALGNTLSMRGDNYAARGYYESLTDMLELERNRLGILLPQVRSDQGDLVDMYMKASNNLGVTLSRLAQKTGDSTLNAKAMVQLSESLRAWDALTRNQETMVRLEGSNLASQNIKYITMPVSSFEPAIYTAIPRVLYGEKMLEQSFISK